MAVFSVCGRGGQDGGWIYFWPLDFIKRLNIITKHNLPTVHFPQNAPCQYKVTVYKYKSDSEVFKQQ